MTDRNSGDSGKNGEKMKQFEEDEGWKRVILVKETKELGYLSLVECFFKWIGVDHSVLEKEVKPVNSWETGP